MAEEGSPRRWNRALGVLGSGTGLGALALAALGLAARSVPPSVTWWPQIAALLLPMTIPVTGLAGLAWGFRASRTHHASAWALAGLHAAAVGVFAVRSLPPPTSSEGDALRVLSLNAAWSRRGEAEDMMRRFEEADADVVALQEVSIRPGPDAGTWSTQGAPLALLTGSLYAVTQLDRPSPASGEMTNGTALFTRLPASQSTPGVLDSVSTTHAGRYTRTELTWVGRRVALYNVHFRSFLGPRPWGSGGGLSSWWDAIRSAGHDFESREKEARALRRALESERLPYLVVGDFNATPHQWSYAHVARGLADALDAEPGWTATFPDQRPVVRIDAILASPHWSVRQARIRPSGISDHRPILADLVLAD